MILSSPVDEIYARIDGVWCRFVVELCVFWSGLWQGTVFGEKFKGRRIAGVKMRIGVGTAEPTKRGSVSF